MTNGRGGHQHFNAGSEAARYLVLRYGNFSFGVGGEENDHARDSGGGNRGQIEYEDEDPRIRPLFEEECANRGVKSEMPVA